MGWSDDDEDILVDLQAIDANVAAAQARASRADDDDDRDDARALAAQFVDDEAEADGDEEEADVNDSHASDDSPRKKSGVTEEEKEETDNKAPASILYMVHQMATEVGRETGMQFSDQMLSLVREVVQDYTRGLGKDVEAFAKHAKRTVVNVEDVMLATTALEAFQQRNNIGVGKKRPKKRNKDESEAEDDGKEDAVAQRHNQRPSTASKRAKGSSATKRSKK